MIESKFGCEEAMSQKVGKLPTSARHAYLKLTYNMGFNSQCSLRRPSRLLLNPIYKDWS